jgi:hypothetical protein
MEYSKGHIYKIICSLDSNFVYIGSTFTTMRQRWKGHKDHYTRFLKDGCKNMSTYKYYDKYGIQNFKIILIKSYNVCRNSQRDNAHLRAYEQLWINKTKQSVNLQNAFNPLLKMDIKIYRKEYQVNNKEKISKNKAEYHINNKEKLNEKSKKHYENNKEKYKEYIVNNKEKINKREREKITCECGSIISKKCIPKHIKSKKHLKLMQNK